MTQKTTTLLFLRRGNEVLLAMKKRGFGAGRWNGAGGKLDPGETIEQALVRECQEEIGVTPISYHKVAVHDFQEQQEGEMKHMIVHTYFCDAWQGDPAETEEMAPQWYALKDIPYGTMWPDDPLWLPQVLAGKKLQTEFKMGADDTVEEYTVTEVEGFA